MLVVKFAFSAKKSWEFDHNSFIYYQPFLTNTKSSLHVCLRILRSLTLFRPSGDRFYSCLMNAGYGQLSCQCHSYIGGHGPVVKLKDYASVCQTDQSEVRTRDNWPIRGQEYGRTRDASVKEFTQDQPTPAPIALIARKLWSKKNHRMIQAAENWDESEQSVYLDVCCELWV